MVTIHCEQILPHYSALYKMIPMQLLQSALCVGADCQSSFASFRISRIAIYIHVYFPVCPNCVGAVVHRSDMLQTSFPTTTQPNLITQTYIVIILFFSLINFSWNFE